MITVDERGIRVSRLWLRDLGDEAHALAWSPDGERLAIAHGEGALTISDAMRGTPLARARAAHEARVHALAWSPRSPILVSGCPRGRLRVWAANEAEPLGELDLGASGIGPVAWSPDGSGVVVASGARLVVTDDALGVQSVATLPVTSVRDLAWRPSSRQIVVSGDAGLQIVDAVSGRVMGAFKEQAALAAIAWSPDGARLAAGAEDGRLFCWDFRASVTGFVDGPGGAVSSLRWSRDGASVIAGSEGGWLIWAPSSVDQDGGPRLTPEGAKGAVRQLDVARSGELVAIAWASRSLEIWRLPDARRIADYELAAVPRVLAWGCRAGAGQVALALDEGLVEMLELVET